MSQSVLSMTERKSETTEREVGKTNTGSLTDNTEAEDEEEGEEQQETSESIDADGYFSHSKHSSGESSVRILEHSSGESSRSGSERSSGGSSFSVTFREEVRETYRRVEVLLLTFEFTDLNLSEETEEVRRAFESLGYTVTRYKIKMKRSLLRLRRILEVFLAKGNNETLLIIYYHGHGGLAEGNKFAFAR